MNGLDHVPEFAGSYGSYSTPGQNFEVSYMAQFRVNSALSLEYELMNRYNDNIAKVKELTGEDLDLPFMFGLDPFELAAKRELGLEATGTFYGPESAGYALAEFDKREARIAELKKTHPELRTMSELVNDVVKMRRDLLAREADISSRAGPLGTIAGFLGGMAGSFTHRDPFLIGSTLAGGWGRTLAMRLATEAGVNMGVEAVQQYSFVRPTQDILGEEHMNPWAAMAMAGAGAVAIRGGLEGAAPLARAAGRAYLSGERVVAPNRANARVFSDLAIVDQDVLMRKVFETAPDIPAVRASKYFWEFDKSLRDKNPYGQSNDAVTRLARELEEVEILFDGQPAPKPFIDTERANKSVDTIWALRRKHALLGGEDADLARGIEKQDVTGKIETRQERIRQLEQRMAGYGTDIAEVKTELVKLRDIDKQLADVDTKLAGKARGAARKSLETKRKKILGDLDGKFELTKDRLAAEGKGLDVATIRDLKLLEFQTKKLSALMETAKRNQLLDVIDFERSVSRNEDIYINMAKAVRRFAGAVGQRVTDVESDAISRQLLDTPSKQFNTKAAELLGELRARPREMPKPLAVIYELESTSKAIEDLEPAQTKIIEDAEDFIVTFREENDVRPDDPTVTFGSGKNDTVKAGLLVPIDGDRVVTAQEIMDDLASDLDLAEAMRVCGA